MTRTKAPTITDVARVAGVSLGTVSRVINNFTDVNAEIRTRVLNAARELNYTRLRQRRSLRATTGPAGTGNVAIVIFGMEDTLAHLPVMSAALQGIEQALAAHGRNVMLANIPAGDRVPPFLSEGRIDGLILKGPNQGLLPSDEECPLLAEIQRFPHVWLMGRLPNGRGDHCNFDTDSAGRLAVEHFQAKGHRRIAFINPKPGQNQFERLKVSFFAAAAQLGLEASLLETESQRSLAWPLPATTRQENVNVLVERWTKISAKSRPTAVFVPSDRTAVQLYSALARHDLQAGRDISVISCNNEQSLLMDLAPVPTTIDIHAEAIGRRTVEQLLWRMANPDLAPSVQILLEPALVDRGSVAAL